MTGTVDPLGSAVTDLRLRLLAALQREAPEAFVGQPERAAAATLRGLGVIDRLAEEQPQLRELVHQVAALREREPRLAFLAAIPDAPILSMQRALSLERAVTGTASDDVAELALLIGLFTVLLDGLLDEVPDLLRSTRPWLDQVMSLKGDSTALATWDDAAAHPVTRVLRWAASEAICRLRAHPGWRDPTAREQFSLATAAAYQSELRSAACRISDRTTALALQRQRIVEKSTTCIWAGALIPFVVHGWPPGLLPSRFADLAYDIGGYGGWLDDTIDVLEDLRADRWSSVLLDLYDRLATLGAAGEKADRRDLLAQALRSPLLTARLTPAGVERFRAVRKNLAAVGLAESDVLPALADVAVACLGDNPAP